MVISCNPDPDSWLYPLIEWYLLEDGLPDPKKDGVLRYYVKSGGEFKWSDNEQDLIDKYSTKRSKARPISFTFISSTIYDNPICIAENPDYLDFLEGLNEVDRQRLLLGNWKIRPKGSNYFAREDLSKADRIPRNAICCRGWDKASTYPSDINPQPDYTACTKMYKTRDGNFYISGEFHDKNHDEQQPEVYGRFRHKPGARDNIIKDQAIYDGPDCKIILPCDPGAHGVAEYIESAKKLSTDGFVVKKDPAANGSSKLQKYSPFSAAVENGFVWIVESTFPNKATLEAFYTEHEAFDGERSSRTRKDDWPDSTATAFNFLNVAKNVPIVVRNQMDSESKAKPVLEGR